MLKALHMHLPEYVELLDIGEGLQAYKIVVLYDKDYLMTFFTQAEAHDVEGQEHTSLKDRNIQRRFSAFIPQESPRTISTNPRALTSCIRIASTTIRLPFDAEIRYSPCLG